MRPAEAVMPTFARHGTIFHDDAADHGVGLDESPAALGQFESKPQVMGVGVGERHTLPR